MSDNKPLYKQLYESIVEDIISGRLRDGEKLPSRRKMSEEKYVSPFTVDATYKLLADTGYIVSKPRQGFFVVSSKQGREYKNPWITKGENRYSFSPNGIDVMNSFDKAFEKIYASTLKERKREYTRYGEKGGERGLRMALSDYLYKFGGLDAKAENIVIGAGADYLITSLMRTLPGKTLYAIGDHDKSEYTFNAFGRKTAHYQTNDNGLIIESLDELDADIIYVIPSNQFPLSVSMKAEQKQALLDWAYKKENRYIIEDGYCSEFSNDRGETLYSLDSKGRVIYLGSFSKTIAPTFRLGYIVLPERLMPVWEKMHGFYYPMVPILDQLALAEYISSGGYRRNIKKLKSLYNEKYCILFDALRTLRGFGDVFRILPYEGGLHLLLRAETRLHENELKNAASEYTSCHRGNARRAALYPKTPS